jgi:1A family penicillin-binding protein
LTTQLYDRKGVLLYKLYKDQNRTLVSLDKVPKDFINAIVSIEDFYTHHGFSLSGTLRAFVTNLKNPNELHGGSTITQQLIKNTLLTKEKSFIRKIKEVILAIETETLYTKDSILEMYINEVGFGGPVYGIQAASQFYFDKNVNDLSLAESSFLAGLPQAPSKLSPFGVSKQLGKARQKKVLDSMVENGFITQDIAQTIYEEPLVFADPKTKILAPHFVQYLTDLLLKEYGEDIFSKGYQITTTIDLDLQAFAQNSINQELKRIGRLNVTNGAVIITNPSTGEILTMVGSKNFFDKTIDGQVNMTTSLRQPGSTVKPINYALAFENGMSPSTMIQDSPISINIFGTIYTPTNYDNRFHGNITLRDALANSYNIPAVKILMQNGVYNMARTAQRMGISTWNDTTRFGPSMTLGSLEVKMTDMAEAYGTFANQGIRVPLKSILEIRDSSGKKISNEQCDKFYYSSEYSCIPEYVLKQSTAYLITDILKDPMARSQAFGFNSILNVKGQEIAVKTGTSNNLKDNWTIGYTTDYLVATWVGNNNSAPMSSVASGITGASPIWHSIFETVTKDHHHVFQKPDSIVTIPICRTTGTLACKECPNVKIESYPKGMEPKSACQPKDFEITSKNDSTNPIVQNLNMNISPPAYH